MKTEIKVFLSFFIISLMSLIVLMAQNLTVNNVIATTDDRWLPLYSSGLGVNLTNSAAQVTAATFTLPANSMGSNGILRVSYILTSPSLTAQIKSALFTLGGVGIKTNVINSGVIMSISGQFSLVNRNDPQVQVCAPGSNLTASYAVFSQPKSIYSINTTIDQTFSVFLTNIVTSDSITLESISAEVLRRN